MNYAELFSKFIYPAYHRLKGDGVLEAQKEIEAFVAGSPAERESAQRDKLNRVLQHAYANCEFYRRRFDQAGVDPTDPAGTFQRIPPLTKADIRQNMPSIRLPDDSPFAPVHRNSTGGSTGEKLDFYYDERCAAMRTATALFIMKQMGLYNGARVAKLWGAQMDLHAMSSVREWVHSFITRTLMLSTYELSDESMAAYADRIASFKPDLLVSYPSPLVAFCDYLVRENRRVPPIRRIVTSAEQLFDWQRETIERTFNSKVLNRYGSREFAGIAHEFPGVRGLQVLSFRLLVEILDDHNQPVAAGERGHIHITDLDNYGMPFIRYRIEDAGVWQHAGHVGSPGGLPVIEAVDGRSFDVIEGTNGNRLGGTYWTILFRSHPGIKQFQVRQTKADHLVVSVIPDDDLNGKLPESIRRYFTDKIHEHCGADMTIDMHPVDAIEQTAAGKKRLVISELK